MLREDTGQLGVELGREVALRENIRLMAVPSIDRIDETFVLAIRVVDAASGEDLLSRSELAEGSNDVLSALDRLARGFRRDLGESRFSISRRGVPLGLATTSSLEALEAWSEGDFHWGNRRYDEALVLFQRAIELDSTFAMAHAALGGVYYFQGDRGNGDLHSEKALSRTDRITERERLWIVAETENWKGNFEGAIDAYNIYLTRYPDDVGGWFRLGYAQMREGRHAEAVLAFDSVVAIDPEDAAAFINLATCQNLLNRREEAVQYYLKAFDLAPAWLTSGNLNHEFGFNYVEKGQFAEAEAAFRKMLEGDDDQQALGNRSLALMKCI
jgi:tetratricopeptide (TPR) repeat protein